MGDKELTPKRQLEAWLRGESLCPNTRGECCPDFSCCTPSLLVPVETRLAFIKGDAETRENMCFDFLAGLAENAGAHLAGTVSDKEDA